MRHLVPGSSRSSLEVRRAEFVDVPAVLRLIERAVERGCANHYRPAQRRAVYLSYAQSLFLDVVGPSETFLASAGDRTVGFALMQPASGRLSALFVDGDGQGRGLGRALLGIVEARARRLRLRRLHGAMSINAVRFYERAGFRPCEGRRALEHVGVVVPVLPMEKFL